MGRLLYLIRSVALVALMTASVKGAPELKVDKWVNLPADQSVPPTLNKDWKGDVVYLYFFQSWCPGCHSSGFPTLKKVHQALKDTEGVHFATIQTVFEGFGTNNAKAAAEIVKRYKLQDIPVAHSGTNGKTSQVMRDYRTRGTPWTVIIDRDGKIVYQDFHIAPEKAVSLIKNLL